MDSYNFLSAADNAKRRRLDPTAVGEVCEARETRPQRRSEAGAATDLADTGVKSNDHPAPRDEEPDDDVWEYDDWIQQAEDGIDSDDDGDDDEAHELHGAGAPPVADEPAARDNAAARAGAGGSTAPAPASNLAAGGGEAAGGAGQVSDIIGSMYGVDPANVARLILAAPKGAAATYQRRVARDERTRKGVSAVANAAVDVLLRGEWLEGSRQRSSGGAVPSSAPVVVDMGAGSGAAVACIARTLEARDRGALAADVAKCAVLLDSYSHPSSAAGPPIHRLDYRSGSAALVADGSAHVCIISNIIAPPGDASLLVNDAARALMPGGTLIVGMHSIGTCNFGRCLLACSIAFDKVTATEVDYVANAPLGRGGRGLLLTLRRNTLPAAELPMHTALAAVPSGTATLSGYRATSSSSCSSGKAAAGHAPPEAAAATGFHSVAVRLAHLMLRGFAELRDAGAACNRPADDVGSPATAAGMLALGVLLASATLTGDPGRAILEAAGDPVRELAGLLAPAFTAWGEEDVLRRFADMAEDAARAQEAQRDRLPYDARGKRSEHPLAAVEHLRGLPQLKAGAAAAKLPGVYVNTCATEAGKVLQLSIGESRALGARMHQHRSMGAKNRFGFRGDLLRGKYGPWRHYFSSLLVISHSLPFSVAAFTCKGFEACFSLALGSLPWEYSLMYGSPMMGQGPTRGAEEAVKGQSFAATVAARREAAREEMVRGASAKLGLAGGHAVARAPAAPVPVAASVRAGSTAMAQLVHLPGPLAAARAKGAERAGVANLMRQLGMDEVVDSMGFEQ